MDFDKMSRGDQFLHLLRIEYEDLLRGARLDISMTIAGLQKYTYGKAEQERETRYLAIRQADYEYYSKLVVRERGKFDGITCTTVV